MQRFVRLFDEENVAPSRTVTAAIRTLAERQHGVVAWRQLTEFGLGKDLIHERMASGQLVRIHRGVFAVGHGAISQRGRWFAAVFDAGPDAALSYGSAAALWGFRRSRGPIEVTRVSGHRRPHGIRVHQTRWLPSDHVEVEAAIPVTSIERTLLDQAERLNARQLERALVDADRSGRVRWGVLEQLVEEANGRRGRKVMRRLIHEVNPVADPPHAGTRPRSLPRPGPPVALALTANHPNRGAGPGS